MKRIILGSLLLGLGVVIWQAGSSYSATGLEPLVGIPLMIIGGLITLKAALRYIREDEQQVQQDQHGAPQSESEPSALGKLIHRVKSSKFLGSTICLIIGWLCFLTYLSMLGQSADNLVDPVKAEQFRTGSSGQLVLFLALVIGVTSYRSAKRRRLGLARNTVGRVIGEILAFVPGFYVAIIVAPTQSVIEQPASFVTLCCVLSAYLSIANPTIYKVLQAGRLLRVLAVLGATILIAAIGLWVNQLVYDITGWSKYLPSRREQIDAGQFQRMVGDWSYVPNSYFGSGEFDPANQMTLSFRSDSTMSWIVNGVESVKGTWKVNSDYIHYQASYITESGELSAPESGYYHITSDGDSLIFASEGERFAVIRSGR